MIDFIKYNLVEILLLLAGVTVLFIVFYILKSKRLRHRVGYYLNFIMYKIGLRKRISGRYISKIHVKESYEHLVELANHPKIIINKETVETPVLLRKQVVAKLLKLADKLPDNQYIKVYSAYRSRIAIYEVWKEEVDRMQKENPDMGRAELMMKVNAAVTNPADSLGGHDTGGAVDVSICSKDGKDMDFGTKYHEKFVNADLTKEQLQNRKYLVKLMKSQDFVNHPNHWWHFSYGDKKWAAYKGRRTSAIYTSAEKAFENTGYVRVIKTDTINVNTK